MRLRLLTEDTHQTLFKGISEWSARQQGGGGLVDWFDASEKIPGFLASYDIARVYSEPALTGGDRQHTIIVSVNIDRSEVEDLTAEFRQWKNDRWQRKHPDEELPDDLDYDVSRGFPKEWRSKIWTTLDGGSAHHCGLSCFGFCEFVYCGIKKPFRIIRTYQSQDDWCREENLPPNTRSGSVR